MGLIIGSLAVYKTMQVIDALSPREAMPWVKIVVGVFLSYGAVLILGIQDIALSGLAVATVSSSIHTVLRFLTLSGDAARRRSLR